MTRRLALLVTLLALGASLPPAMQPSLLPAAHAQDDDDKKDEEREKTPEEKELLKIGKEFAKKDSAALLSRLPEKSKVRIWLGSGDDRYLREQATEVLDDWFESRSITKVKLQKTSGGVGEFRLKLRRKGREEERTLVLEIRIKKDEDTGKFVLKSIKVTRE